MSSLCLPLCQQHRTLIPLSCFSAFWQFLVGIKPAWSLNIQGHELGVPPVPAQPGSPSPGAVCGLRVEAPGVFSMSTLPMETSPATKLPRPGPPARPEVPRPGGHGDREYTKLPGMGLTHGPAGPLQPRSPRGKDGSVPGGILPGEGSTDRVLCLGKGRAKNPIRFSLPMKLF